MTSISVAVVLIYLIILFVLSVFFVKRALNSYEEYAFCGRQLTIGFIIFTYLGTWIGGGTIIGLAGGVYVNGVNQYWIFAVSCIMGFFFVFIFLKKIRGLHLRSIGDMFALRFPEHNETVRIPVAVGLIVRMVTMIGMQFTALSYMLTYVLDIDKNLAVLTIFIVITGYTCLSGLWAVVATDVLQGFLQVIGMIVLLVLSIKASGGFDNVFAVYEALGKEAQLNLINTENMLHDIFYYGICFGVFFLMGDQSDWVRIYSCKTDKTAFWGFLIPLTITLILLLLPTYIGLFQGSLAGEGIEQGQLIYWFVFEKVSKATALFLLITLFAAIMSTADTYMHACGTIFAHDILKRFINPNAQDRELIFWNAMGVIAAGAIGFAFAININNIILLWTWGIAIATIIMVPEYFMAWFSRIINTDGALCGMIVGIVYISALLLTSSNFNLMVIAIGIIANVTIAYIVSLITGKANIEEIQSTFYFDRLRIGKGV